MAKEQSRIVAVPKTPRRAFNKKRKPSALLLNQVAHLEWAARPASRRKPGQLRPKKVKTEGEAAERIAYLTALVRNAQLLPTADPPTKASKAGRAAKAGGTGRASRGGGARKKRRRRAG